MLAEALNLKYQQEVIALGAMLHDIGMFIVPKNILQKKDALLPEEQIFIRQHSNIGLSMLSSSPIDQICLDIVQQHHEMLDGSGYPFGLTGNTPYRPRISIEAVIKELKSNTDKYPKDIVDVFISLIY